ncbi:MAG TPA: DUF3365 domain-containing protein [Pirellulaceae bacterium]|nr:DUF3365 domain-containing protein [Pirellulaceae bacterium]
MSRSRAALRSTFALALFALALLASLFLGGTAVRIAAVSADEPAPAPRADRPTLAEARRQAAILHTTLHSTLQVVHHRLYRPDEGLPLPAAVLKEVFADLETEQRVKLRWLAVDGQAMNEEHKPRTDFEREAVKQLKAGRPEHSQVQDGVYRRAAPITLINACLKCHVPDRKNTADRTAGLIIAIPIRD